MIHFRIPRSDGITWGEGISEFVKQSPNGTKNFVKESKLFKVAL